jgi:DNA-binding transcriptional LysR family regulator
MVDEQQGAVLGRQQGQSALSDAIKALERDLGCKVFERGPSGMRPAEGSEAVFAAMERVIAETDRLLAQAADLASGLGGRVRVLAVLSSMETVVPRLFRAWDEQVPGLLLDLDVAPPHRQLLALEKGECDIGLMRAPVEQEGCIETLILREPLLCIAPRSWQDAESLADLEALGERPMVRFGADHGPGIFPETCRILQGIGIQPRISGETDDMAALIAMVACGLGWAVIPASLKNLHPNDIVVIDDHRLPTLDLVAVHKESNDSPGVQRFVDLAAQIGLDCERELRNG